MQKSEQINELAIALSKTQSELEGAEKNSDNPFFKSRYADLASVWEALRVPLTKHGLSVSQCLEVLEGKTVLTSILMHSSGQYISSTIPVVSEKPGPQAMGSAISYARRYSLAAITGIYQADDDAEGAQGRVPLPAQEPFKTLPVSSGTVYNERSVRLPVPTGVMSKLHDDSTWTDAPLNFSETIGRPQDRTKEEWKSHAVSVAELAGWSKRDLVAEVKKREFFEFDAMSPTQMEEMILFVKGNPKK